MQACDRHVQEKRIVPIVPAEKQARKRAQQVHSNRQARQRRRAERAEQEVARPPEQEQEPVQSGEAGRERGMNGWASEREEGVGE